MAYRWRDTESDRLRWQISDRGIHWEFRMERNDPVRQFAAYRESADAFHRHCEQSPGRRTLEWKLGRAVALRSHLGFDPRARPNGRGSVFVLGVGRGIPASARNGGTMRDKIDAFISLLRVRPLSHSKTGRNTMRKLLTF